MTIIATTNRLRLRQLVPTDVEAMHRVFGDPEVMRFGTEVRTKNWVQKWISLVMNHHSTQGYGCWAVETLAHDEVIGYCGLTYLDDVRGQGEIELGYRLITESWGHGYATEAAQCSTDFAFNSLRKRRLIGLVDPDNAPSIAVLEKVGMSYECDFMREGHIRPDRLYAVER